MGERRIKEMKGNTRLRDLYFWSALLILLATVYFFLASYYRWLNFRFTIGGEPFHHWLGWIGTLFIAFFTPAYYILKRRNPKRVRMLIGIHVLGNLLAFLSISVHFAHQLGRPPQFFPKLGTGVTLVAAVILLVSTGFFQRFLIGRRLRRYWRFIHVSVTMSFYLIIIVHILHGLGII
ncbi:MAG: hypothetical protein ACETVQ_03365 [Candidatus Bathyarchaeia archaeon]